MADLPEDELNEISQALFSGQKILAIKRYREATGVGLKQAKDAIDSMERMLRQATPGEFRDDPRRDDSLRANLAALLEGGAAANQPMSEETAGAITQALFTGKKVEAVKLYREAEGCDLKEAKEAMDALETALREETPESFRFGSKSGCMSVLVIGGLLVGLGGYTLA